MSSESHLVEPDSETAKPAPWTWWGAWLFRLSILVGLLLVGCVIFLAYVCWRPESWFAEEVDRIRARGQPLTADEMRAHFGPTAEQERLGKNLLPLLQASRGTQETDGLYKDWGTVWLMPPDKPELLAKERPLPPDAVYASRQAVIRELLARSGEFKDARLAVDFASRGLFSELEEHISPVLRLPASAARLLLFHGRRELARGKGEEAVQSFEAATQLFQLTACDPSEWTMMHRIDTIRMANAAIPRYIASPDLSSDHYARLRAALRQMRDPKAFANANIAMTSSHYVTISQIREQRATGKISWVEERLMLWPAIGSLSLQSQAQDCFEPPSASPLEPLIKFQRLLEEEESQTRWPIVGTGPDSAFVVGNHARLIFDQWQIVLTLRDCADLALSCEIFRQRNGRWPMALQDIAADYPEGLPRDAWALGKDYRLREDQYGIRVYSVGSNGKDDGGTWGEINDDPDAVIFVPHQKTREKIAPDPQPAAESPPPEEAEPGP